MKCHFHPALVTITAVQRNITFSLPQPERSHTSFPESHLKRPCQIGYVSMLVVPITLKTNWATIPFKPKQRNKHLARCVAALAFEPINTWNAMNLILPNTPTLPRCIMPPEHRGGGPLLVRIHNKNNAWFVSYQIFVKNHSMFTVCS